MIQGRKVFGLLAVPALTAALVVGCMTGGEDLDEEVGSSAAPLVAAPARDAIPDQYIVVFKDSVGVQGLKSAMSRISFTRGESRLEHQYTVIPGFSARLMPEDLEALRFNADVAYIEQDQIMRASATKPASGQLDLDRHDHCPAVDDNVFNDNGCNGSGVLVYVVDTGIRASHQQFGGRVNTGRGFTAINDGRGTTDCNGHGSHVSSTAAGSGFGLASAATLVPVRVLDCSGSGSNAGVIAGVNHVANNCGNGERCVANMSLGGGVSAALDSAVAAAVDSGVPFAVAAGNESRDAINSSPAREPKAITVGCASDSGYPASTGSNSVSRCSFSNFGSRVDVWASGLTILGADDGSDTATQTISGTSMSSPHVAGAIAQMLSCRGNLSSAQVEAQLDLKSIGSAMSNEQGGQDLFLCSDYNDADGNACACSGNPPPPPPPADSCQGRCGNFNPALSCQCDSQCTIFGDCCADFPQLCQ
ncbi:MAG TPA: S8 family serine peptidase [Kofleriaceae bacterium]|nr:S8 family serine peptidase [Kofleriaceae bacterium]